MKRVVPTAQELQAAAEAMLGGTTPEQRDYWVKSPVTAGMFLIVERIRMECIEQAEYSPETSGLLMSQAQILGLLAEELSETITETAEYVDPDEQTTDNDDDAETGRPSPRRRAHYTP